MSKPLKIEIRAVAEALDQGPGELEDIASEAIQALDRVRAEQETYGLLFREGDTLICVSPFRTIKAVERWATKNGLSPDNAVRVVVKHPEGV